MLKSRITELGDTLVAMSTKVQVTGPGNAPGTAQRGVLTALSTCFGACSAHEIPHHVQACGSRRTCSALVPVLCFSSLCKAASCSCHHECCSTVSNGRTANG